MWTLNGLHADLARKDTVGMDGWMISFTLTPRFGRYATYAVQQLYINVRTCAVYHFLDKLGASLGPAVAS
jgi:hypothetical protein